MANRRNLSAQQVLTQVLDSGSEYEGTSDEDEVEISQMEEVESDGESSPPVRAEISLASKN